MVSVGAKDNTTRIYAIDRFKNFKVYCLGGHSEPIVRVFFDKDFTKVYTVSRNGHLLIWECSLTPEQLEPDDGKPKSAKKSAKDDNEEEDVEDEEKDESKTQVANEEEQSKTPRLFYTRSHRHFLNDALPKNDDQSAAVSKRPPELTTADYHSGTRILVTGFSNGVFLIHELPEASLVHSLSISDQSIMSVTLNPAGDWIAFGCEYLGQLLV